MRTEEHIRRIGTRFPHKCYHWRYIAEHDYPRILKTAWISITLNSILIYVLVSGVY